MSDTKQEDNPLCHNCGKPATIFMKNPYVEELYPEDENEPRWWCDDCYHESVMDI